MGKSLENIKYLHENNYPQNPVICAIAQNGNLESLQWLHEHNFPWNIFTCTYDHMVDI